VLITKLAGRLVIIREQARLPWRESAGIGLRRIGQDKGVRSSVLSVSRRGGRISKAEPALSVIYANARP
jgi:hypothetical protein